MDGHQQQLATASSSESSSRAVAWRASDRGESLLLLLFLLLLLLLLLLSKGIVSRSYIEGWFRTLGRLGTRRNRPSFSLLGVDVPRGYLLHTTDTHAEALARGSTRSFPP